MNLIVEKLKVSDLLSATKLVERSFDQFVAPTLNKEGIATFKKGLSVKAFEKRLDSGNLFLVCRNEKEIVGVSEIRDKNHLHLFFVEATLQKNGIGRKMFNALTSHIQENEVTVNSSLNAVDAYKKLGFHESGISAEVSGIKYQPMIHVKGSNSS